jgi:hypothetical protein
MQGDVNISTFVVCSLWDLTLQITITIKIILILKLKITVRIKSIISNTKKWMNKKELKFVAGAKTKNRESKFIGI